MMSTDLPKADPQYDHYYCPFCGYEDISICGYDLTDTPEGHTLTLCAFCEEIDICPICGKLF